MKRVILAIATILYAHAYWNSPTSATVTWYQTARICLWYQQAPTFQPVFVACYAKYPLTLNIEFGHEGPLSGDLRPQQGANYILQNPQTGELIKIPLEYRKQYFPVFRH